MLHEHDHHAIVELLVAFDDGVLQVVQVCVVCLRASLREALPTDAGLPLIGGPADRLSGGETSFLALVAS